MASYVNQNTMCVRCPHRTNRQMWKTPRSDGDFDHFLWITRWKMWISPPKVDRLMKIMSTKVPGKRAELE